jgi:Arc/MetJ-type ribon-helix-helix transcriptional regulator
MTESITLELEAEVVAKIRSAVQRGQYASLNDAVSDALSHWRATAEDTKYLRDLWDEAMQDEGPGEPMEVAMDRLETKYRARYDEAAKKPCA